MRMPTASALPVLLRCPGQSAIPHHASTSAAAEEGTRHHETYMPALVRGRLPDTPRGRALREARIDFVGGRAEVAYALDLGSGLGSMRARELAPQHHRDYSGAREGELCGTLDLVTDRETGEAKFGVAEQERPERHAQMWFGALARWAHDAGLYRMRLVHVRPPDREGRCRAWTPWHDPTLDDLARWRDAIAGALRRVAAARAAWASGDRELGDHLVLGDHCGRCDARLVCPAIGATVTHDNEASKLRMARAAKSRADRALALVEATLATAGTVEGEGLAYERVVKYRRQIDTARALIAIAGLAQHATLTLSTAALDEWAAQQESLGSTRKERVEAANKLLEEHDALSWSVSSRLEERDHGEE